MKCTDLYVRAVASCLPPRVPIAAALADGRYADRHAERTRQESVAITEELAGTELAAVAGRRAVARAGVPAADVDIVLHAALFDYGLPMWMAAGYVANEVGIAPKNLLVSEARSGCNGVVNVHLAATHLMADPDVRAALCVAGDVYHLPAVDRYSVGAFVFGDGGSAMVLGRESGFARLLSVSSFTDARHEGLSRGDEQLGADVRHPINLTARALAYWKHFPEEEMWTAHNDGVRGAVHAALNDAGIGIEDIDHVVFPSVGHDEVVETCADALGIGLDRTTWCFARTVGHLGPADSFAGLEHLVLDHDIPAGGHVLLLGSGGAVVWTAAVLEMLDRPSWAGARPQAGPCTPAPTSD